MSVLAGLLVVIAAWLVCPWTAQADGIIVPVAPGGGAAPPQMLSIRYHRVCVSIQDQMAVTRVDQAFANDTPRDLEGDYIFPVPPGASISSFAVYHDGRKVRATILSREEALERYKSIVLSLRDPALLEYVGRNAYRARIYPILAFDTTRIEIQYTEILPSEAGLVRYTYPLSIERLSGEPIPEVSIEIEIQNHGGIGTIFCPSHDISVVRTGSSSATVRYEAHDVLPDKDLVLYYGLSDSSLDVNVLSYREPGEDGFFVLTAMPRLNDSMSEIIPRDLWLLIDTSGSMRGEKLQQAKDALHHILQELNARDRFNVLAFSSACSALSPHLLEPEDLAQAVEFIDGLQAGGGTNIEAALRRALLPVSPGRPQIVVLITDGLPTEGEIRLPQLLELARSRSHDSRRLFTFGVGYDVDTILLDSLASENGGSSTYVRPQERLDASLSSFYDKISLPVVTDLRIDYGASQVSRCVPAQLPDLFAGEQIVILGRYGRSGDTTITIRGTREDGRSVVRAFKDVRLRILGGASFIPHLWATRQIGHLLACLRLNGPDADIIDEIVDLSIRYGIVTPYTSFLVEDPAQSLTQSGRREFAENEMTTAQLAAKQRRAGTREAVERSISEKALTNAERPLLPEADIIRMVGAKTFIMRGSSWVDTAFDAKATLPEQITWGTPRFFELLAGFPELGPVFSLGTDVIVTWQDQAYHISVSSGRPQHEPEPRAAGAPQSTTPPRSEMPRPERFISHWLLGWLWPRTRSSGPGPLLIVGAGGM